ncbi:carboxypeptidase regulatory-like domain-containing protein [Proteiniphilum sp. X52]|nr:carboxypeptidase regulatory-like domain-containing protein [Proteiniphilum sp. X52]
MLISLYPFHGIKAQSVAEEPVGLEIRECSVNAQVISHILKITNRSEQIFTGTVLLDPLSELRSLSLGEREISVAPDDSVFVAYRLIAGRDVGAGKKTIRYILVNAKKERVLARETHINIEEREQIFFMTDDTPLMITRQEDSVRVHVAVNNSGNTYQEVTLVFNVPNLREAPAFTEMKITMAPMEQKRFTHSFIPSGNLLSSAQFSVHVTAMKGKDKMIFGSKTVTVQNVFTVRRYVDTHPARGLYPGQGLADNSVTLSCRQYNATSNMVQLQGGGYMNLPSGYLHLKGNIYKYNSGHTPMITNTSLMYKFEENEFTIGNVSEQAELPLFGRGGKAMLSTADRGKTLTFGAVDQNFNLIGSQPWFTEYYSFYMQGALGANNPDRGMEATYIYQKNPYEKAIYNVGGLQWRSLLGRNWSIHLEAHGALGSYENLPEGKFSGAAELRYRGNLPFGVVLDGSGYYSDGYFPGSRKGTLSFTQGVNKRLSENTYVSGSIGYNRTAPQSYSYTHTYRSENSYGNIMLSLPKLGRVTSSLYYRHQGESSPSYASLLDETTVSGNVRMTSHRMGWQARWQSPNARHSLFGTLEAGFFADPLEGGPSGQAKTTLNYSFREVMIDASYQKGACYLYEYMMARQQHKGFNRFASSVSINKKISKKLSFSSGVNFSHDVCQGSVPSANLTANFFAKDNRAFFMNAYWYRHRFVNHSDMFHVQVGVTWNFSKSQPMKGRKSKVVAQVYYDHNANNRYDDGDEPAGDYLLSIDNKAFISDKEGTVRYSRVPYGEYVVSPLQAGRWCFDREKITVNSAGTVINIPLKQSGTLQGRVGYISDENSVEILPRYEGHRFMVMDAGGAVVQTVVTDADGKFTTFLPMGTYTITLDAKTLPEHSQCKDYSRAFTIEAGKTTVLDLFQIEVKERKINIKRFFASD